MWEIWAKLLLSKALKTCPKSNKFGQTGWHYVSKSQQQQLIGSGMHICENPLGQWEIFRWRLTGFAHGFTIEKWTLGTIVSILIHEG